MRLSPQEPVEKLNPRWTGPFKVIEVYRDGAKYKLQNLFDDTVIERTVDKIKPYIDDEKWLVEPQELTLDEPADVSMEVPPESAPSEVEPVERPKRKVVPPPRLLEEM